MTEAWVSAFLLRDGTLGMALVTFRCMSCLAYSQLTKERNNDPPPRSHQPPSGDGFSKMLVCGAGSDRAIRAARRVIMSVWKTDRNAALRFWPNDGLIGPRCSDCETAKPHRGDALRLLHQHLFAAGCLLESPPESMDDANSDRPSIQFPQNLARLVSTHIHKALE